MKLGFSDGLGQVLTIRALKHVPPTPEHKSHTGVKSHTNRIHKSRKRALCDRAHNFLHNVRDRLTVPHIRASTEERRPRVNLTNANLTEY